MQLLAIALLDVAGAEVLYLQITDRHDVRTDEQSMQAQQTDAY